MAVAKTNSVAKRLALACNDARLQYHRLWSIPIVWVLLMPAILLHIAFSYMLTIQCLVLNTLAEDTEPPPAISKFTRYAVLLLKKVYQLTFVLWGWDSVDEAFAHSIERFYRFSFAVGTVLMIAIEAFVSILLWTLLIQWGSERVGVVQIHMGGL